MSRRKQTKPLRRDEDEEGGAATGEAGKDIRLSIRDLGVLSETASQIKYDRRAMHSSSTILDQRTFI